MPRSAIAVWSDDEIARLLYIIARTKPPVPTADPRKTWAHVQRVYNHTLASTKRWTAKSLYSKFNQIVTSKPTGAQGGRSSLQGRCDKLHEIVRILWTTGEIARSEKTFLRSFKAVQRVSESVVREAEKFYEDDRSAMFDDEDEDDDDVGDVDKVTTTDATTNDVNEVTTADATTNDVDEVDVDEATNGTGVKKKGGKRWYVPTEIKAIMLLYAETSREPAHWSDSDIQNFRTKTRRLTEDRLQELKAKLPSDITAEENKELRSLQKYIKKPYDRDADSLHRKFVAVKSDYGRDGNLQTTRTSFVNATKDVIHVDDNDEKPNLTQKSDGGGGPLAVIANAMKARARSTEVSPGRKKRRKITEALSQISSLNDADVSDEIKQVKRRLLGALGASLKQLADSVTVPGDPK